MRALFLAFALTLICCGGAFADATSDCEQDNDRDLSIRGCTLIIEGRAKGEKASAYEWRGGAYDGKGDYDRAIADYDQAIRLDPNYAAAYNGRGNVYYDKHDDDRAIADYDQAIRLDPKYVSAYLHRGDVYYDKHDDDRAIAEYGLAISLDPKNADAYNGRGNAFYDKHDYDRAIADYDQAIRLDPKYAQVYNNRGGAFRQKGKYDRAIVDYDRAIALDPNKPSFYEHRGLAYFKTGNIDRVIADYDQVINLQPKNAKAYAFRALMLSKKGDYDRANADYNRALSLDPDLAKGEMGVVLAPLSEAVKAAKGAPTLKTKPRIVAIGRRVALVIGNSAYKAVPELPNPKTDAGAVAGEFTRLGFEVIEKHDLGGAAMRRVLGEFEDKTAGAEWAFVYYAGHGMELNGRNWLIPVDAELVRATDTPDEAVPLERVLDRLAAVTKLRIVVLDACRNNPFLTRMVMNRVSTRAVARGLTAVEPSHGEVVFYAARDGSVVLDGKGANSPFAAALVKHMDEDGVELGRFFRRVTSSVLAATDNQQEPFVYGRIPDEDFYFKPPR